MQEVHKTAFSSVYPSTHPHTHYFKKILSIFKFLDNMLIFAKKMFFKFSLKFLTILTINQFSHE
jgi:hypothetical protein